METISLKMDSKLLKDIDNIVKNHRYSTRTEFIRDSIRNKLTELEKEEVIRKLANFKGNLKNKSKKGYEDSRELAAKKIAKEYGIDL